MDRLCFPFPARCFELDRIMSECSIKDLHDFFPILVQSVFGSGVGGNQVGWGLRMRRSNTHIQALDEEFNVLMQFFSSQGPMFDLCYRLLNDQIKFEVPIDMLPVSRRTNICVNTKKII